ncbi:MAG TPA: alanyl-tRNA editing protein [Conexivisphaerales archaeon]|nr:alanyl-tRNA editing protein [Conexivisphaerales archaeon]
MTKRLFWEDAYLRDFKAKVIRLEGQAVVLDQTCFNPRGGGLVSDLGALDGVPLSEVTKSGDDILHVTAAPHPFSVGQTVTGVLDWERRYGTMKMHTATHILSNVVNSETGALITGNSVAPDESRVDFSLEEFDKGRMESYIAEVNEVIGRDLPVRTYFLKREEALSMPGMVKLAQAAPPEAAELRIVEIGDFDRQADGGVHVARTSEIGRVRFLRADNKGRSNRRVYFALE